MRDVIHSFHESKYAKCLQLLDEMKVIQQTGAAISFSDLSIVPLSGQPSPGSLPGPTRRQLILPNPESRSNPVF